VKPNGDGIAVPDPEPYPGLLLAFEEAAKGASNRAVAERLNAAGYRTTVHPQPDCAKGRAREGVGERRPLRRKRGLALGGDGVVDVERTAHVNVELGKGRKLLPTFGTHPEWAGAADPD
jgi:hypothetical protein